MTLPHGIGLHQIPATDDYDALVDRVRYLEIEVTIAMDENDQLRSCLRASQAAVQELQHAITGAR